MESILNRFRLDGKCALVTGGSGGLGQYFVRALLEVGAKVAFTGASSRCGEFEKTLKEEGYDVLGIQVDLGSYEACEDVFNKSLAFFGGEIHVLVNCAGVQHRCPAEDFSVEEWTRILNTNLNSYFYLSQMSAKNMLEKGIRGSIVNIGSISNTFGGRNIPAYATSKSAVHGMTRALSNDWAGRGIRVNTISPGYMKTDLTATLRNVGNQVELVNARIPMERWGTGADLQGALLYLASDASAFTTGSTITIDGGFSCS